MNQNIIDQTTVHQKILDWLNQYPDLKNKRPNWDDWFLLFAFITSRRSSCFRHKVGAVIVKEKDVIATGYNGAPAYQNNCLEIGSCYRNDHNIKSNTQLELCRASGSHAESNSIAYASKNGHSILGATMYIYGHFSICNACRGQIANAGIQRVLHFQEDGEIREYHPSAWSISPIDTDTDLIKKLFKV